ncbi:MAG: hypothetical protein M1830_009525 [Pleopsidium flavum]|nr:MAG: hypothetical protein M1830_009525 [Pleopsidium flavum]
MSDQAGKQTSFFSASLLDQAFSAPVHPAGRDGDLLLNLTPMFLILPDLQSVLALLSHPVSGFAALILMDLHQLHLPTASFQNSSPPFGLINCRPGPHLIWVPAQLPVQSRDSLHAGSGCSCALHVLLHLDDDEAAQPVHVS